MFDWNKKFVLNWILKSNLNISLTKENLNINLKKFKYSSEHWS